MLEKELRRLRHAQIRKLQPLRLERTERRGLDARIIERRIRRQQRKRPRPELVAQFPRQRAGKKQRSRLVPQADQLRARHARAQVPLHALVPDVALQLEERHRPQPPVDVHERALEIARVLAQPPQQRRIPLAGLVRGAQLPFAPVIAPEGLDLRVVALVQLARRGEKCAQRALPVAAHELPRDEPLAVLQKAEPLRVEVVDHAGALHLGHALAHPSGLGRREVAHRHLESVGGDVGRRQRLGDAPDQLEPQIARLHDIRRTERAAVHADQLLGPSLFVLEPADGQVAPPHREFLGEPLQRLQRRNLLLVHPVDPDRTLGVVLEPVPLAHDEVFGPLLDLHAAPRTRQALR